MNTFNDAAYAGLAHAEAGGLTPITSSAELNGAPGRFPQFHRRLFAMSDVELQHAAAAFNRWYAANQVGQMDDVFCDVQLVQGGLHYQLAVRSLDGFDRTQVAEEIAHSFHEWTQRARGFADVTDERLLALLAEACA